VIGSLHYGKPKSAGSYSKETEPDTIATQVNRDDLWGTGAPHGAIDDVLTKIQHLYQLSEEQLMRSIKS
jgi:hypothetical protein